MKFIFNDGGRTEAGFKGFTGDCAVRAISIATKTSYSTVYKDLSNLLKQGNSKKGGSNSVRNGVSRDVIHTYLNSMGWKWVPTMFFGRGCTTHLVDEELPKGNIIVNLSKHVAAVIDGVLNDTFDCSRDGSRCVYGYWRQA